MQGYAFLEGFLADPTWWNLEHRDGRLAMQGHDLSDLASQYGTPLHVVCAATIRARTQELKSAFAAYPGEVSLHFSYKTNTVAGVLKVLHGEGVGAEVVDGYELYLARRLGVDNEAIVFNGPNKSDEELTAALNPPVGLLVVDGLGELDRLEKLLASTDIVASIALRICPDVVPRGMNASSMTGSRKNQFGLDLKDGAHLGALKKLSQCPNMRFRGVHAHIGSGIHDFRAFQQAANRTLQVQAEALQLGMQPDLLDLGGGLGTRFSREFTTFEMLRYLATGRLPREPKPAPEGLFARYGEAVSNSVTDGCHQLDIPMPKLILEPGRSLVSDAGILLLTVGTVRERPGIGRFALTDGGAMTVSMMFLSEYHSVLLANREAPNDGCTSVFGRLPSPMDVVYRNMPLPQLAIGDILAVMDAGAYFTSTATNFGGPRPAVVLVDHEPRLIRRRETFEHLAAVELFDEEQPQ